MISRLPPPLRIIMTALGLFIAVPYGLAILYLYLNPASMPMMARTLAFQRVERQWVPLSAISQPLRSAVVAAEDDAFCTHHGIDFRQLFKSIDRAQRTDRDVKATSTITQQVAKNLFFWQGRSWVRKILETPLAIWIDLIWPKSRILEVYLNIAQWGDGVYGAQAAAQFHFNTDAQAVTYGQAALLATSLPNPIQRVASRPGPAQRAIAVQLMGRLQRAGPDLSCLK